ncbi:MAG: HAMP domain-containing histidine kinase [Ruminococcus sp.]|nr:HAMP domain-containing histidine kinase [Ruminococcus sp.]
MKEIKLFAVLLALCYIVSAGGFCIWYGIHSSRRGSSANVTINRINAEIAAAETEPAETISQRFESWRAEYPDCPDHIEFVPIDENSGNTFVMKGSGSSSVCAVRRGGRFVGAVQYESEARSDTAVTAVAAALMSLCFLLSGAFLIYIYRNVIKPFGELSEYPERLAREQTSQRLPESRSRYFGKYIWGMNMLADRLEDGRRRISRLEYERQTLIASIAHGVKTPVANIRLYASAVMTGLYPESRDAEIAAKIDANADKIGKMANDLLNSAATSVTDYEPDLNPFYLGELKTMIEKEFADRMEISRVPLRFITEGDKLVNSDRWGLFRVISQLIENALKYGDGGGISVELSYRDDEICIVVRNKGELLPEKELPYVFRSYWRGSNASEKDGSGIGLFVAHEIVKRLGGTILARRLEETSEMEFIICIGD